MKRLAVPSLLVAGLLIACSKRACKPDIEADLVSIVDASPPEDAVSDVKPPWWLDASDATSIIRKGPFPNFRPRPDRTAPNGVYIPRDLDEAAREFLAAVDPAYLEFFRGDLTYEEWALSSTGYAELGYRPFYGLSASDWIRECWIWPEESALAARFRENGVLSDAQMTQLVERRIFAAIKGLAFEWDAARVKSSWIVRFTTAPGSPQRAPSGACVASVKGPKPRPSQGPRGGNR